MFFMFPSNLKYGGWRCSSVDRLLAYHGRNLGVSFPDVPGGGEEEWCVPLNSVMGGDRIPSSRSSATTKEVEVSLLQRPLLGRKEGGREKEREKRKERL